MKTMIVRGLPMTALVTALGAAAMAGLAVQDSKAAHWDPTTAGSRARNGVARNVRLDTWR